MVRKQKNAKALAPFILCIVALTDRTTQTQKNIGCFTELIERVKIRLPHSFGTRTLPLTTPRLISEWNYTFP